MRRLATAITRAELLAWASYLRARNGAPARPWIRDAAVIEHMAVMAYGG